MTREIKTIKLSGCEVDIITFLTWGEKETLQSEIMKGAKLNESGMTGFDSSVLLESKYKLLEFAIKEIRCGEEKTQYTKDWVNNLSIEDGDLLYETVDELNGKKKA